MRLACIHTHTFFCDGSDDIETFCQRAHEKGLLALGFSAHAPVFKKTGLRSSWHLDEDRLFEYLESVALARKRWEGRLPVYLGLEVDFISGLMGPADRGYREMGLDYIIGSVHYVVPRRGEPFAVDDSAGCVERGIKESYGGDPLGMVDAYYEAEAAMIRSGGFDLLGHPDLVKKNNSGSKLFSEETDFYREKSAAAAALMAGTGIPAEVNTGGMNRGKIKDCYPSPRLLKLFREKAVPIVINADAHEAEHLDGHYEEAREAALAAGYTGTAIFGGRKAGEAVWESVKL